MANYKEQIVTGEVSVYTRCIRGHFYNKSLVDNNAISAISFDEEIVTKLPTGNTFVEPVSNSQLLQPFGDGTETFNLLNPYTDEIIGTKNFKDVYDLLYSLYRHVANKRDEAINSMPNAIV